MLDAHLFIAAAVVLIGAIPAAMYWSEMEFGQRIYVCGLLLLSPFLTMSAPYRNPLDKTIHWSFAGSVPHYQAGTLLSQIAGASQPMPVDTPRRRRFLGIAAALGFAGWFVVPSLVDRVAYRRD